MPHNTLFENPARLTQSEPSERYNDLHRLSQRLEAAMPPETTLATVAQTLAQCLQAPYVAIVLQRTDIDDYEIVAEYQRLKFNDQDSRKHLNSLFKV